jgi:hypothetical protein
MRSDPVRTALLNLAATEHHEFGFVTTATRARLDACGITSVELEQYFSIIGVN